MDTYLRIGISIKITLISNLVKRKPIDRINRSLKLFSLSFPPNTYILLLWITAVWRQRGLGGSFAGEIYSQKLSAYLKYYFEIFFFYLYYKQIHHFFNWFHQTHQKNKLYYQKGRLRQKLLGLAVALMAIIQFKLTIQHQIQKYHSII